MGIAACRCSDAGDFYGEPQVKLSIVIPAYNEEDAIASIIERTLDARQHIVANSPVTEVGVIVVSDGSVDETARIARRYDEVEVIEFERNRGYGAAIKRGFAETNHELVGFLDADGTCDPRFFADLCKGLDKSGAAIALGSRLGPDSQMPKLRRVGNRMYAVILSVLTNRVVNDTASGMRVIRRAALEKLYPLPDGLHFTPAMSARALLDDHLPVLELPMTYKERVGESKLNVLRDGWRFFRTIMEMTLLWRPSRVLLSSAAVCLLAMVMLALHPIEMWVRVGRLHEHSIYRLMFCSFLGSVSMMLLSALVVSHSLRTLSSNPQESDALHHRLLANIFSARMLIFLTIATLIAELSLVGPGLWSYVTLRTVAIHWSRVVLAGLFALALCQLYMTAIIINIIKLHASQNEFVATRRTQIDMNVFRDAVTPLSNSVAVSG